MLKNSQLQEMHHHGNVAPTGYCITGLIFLYHHTRPFPFKTIDVSKEELLNTRLQEERVI